MDADLGDDTICIHSAYVHAVVQPVEIHPGFAAFGEIFPAIDGAFVEHLTRGYGASHRQLSLQSLALDYARRQGRYRFVTATLLLLIRRRLRARLRGPYCHPIAPASCLERVC